ncbi:hypothetical protein FOA43_002665 [Brettanomyces nanus]|uniref:Uncharacterized protein n=1 Tax=Eeniella nana TaxID=13502 RepID=A0A875S329_EENNA|nr:uncharacterized protein FOA43_002665 [Brettanomyces nanus]QPG75313.1 hypothetical protein FOA43_002665 [Brettanomyces nanus]
MSESLYINEQQPSNDHLDTDFRVLVLIQNKETSTTKNDGKNTTTDISVEQADMKGKLLEGIHTFTGINKFFDEFDRKIAYPNEGSLKYDVGSDGFIVIVVERDQLRKEVGDFIDDYLKNVTKESSENGDADNDEESEDDLSLLPAKRPRK